MGTFLASSVNPRGSRKAPLARFPLEGEFRQIDREAPIKPALDYFLFITWQVIQIAFITWAG
jgi:hypothetical protein